jgi:hypothetical protein
MDDKDEVCPGCKLVLPVFYGSRHPYFGATASCWALFLQLLAREYSEPAYMTMHRTTVDAYAAQHPGSAEPRSIQSVNVHLVGLYLVLERRLQPDFVRSVIGGLTKQKSDLCWLPPAATLGSINVMDVLEAGSPADHENAVRAWGHSVWTAWATHRETIVALAAKALAGFG